MTRKKKNPSKHDMEGAIAEMGAQLAVLDRLLGLAVSFRITPDTHIEWRLPPEDAGSATGWWAIARRGEVMDKEGHWEMETRAENRTDMLRHRYYYPTVGEAIAVYAAVNAGDMTKKLPDSVREGLTHMATAIAQQGGLPDELREKVEGLVRVVEAEVARG